MVEDAWQFTPVIELNNCLSSGAERLGIEHAPLSSDPPSSHPPSPDDRQNPPGLGNFDKIWKFLNLPLSVPSVTHDSQLEVAVATVRTEGLSDQLGTNKGVRWWDGNESADLSDQKESSGSILATGTVKKLTKKERVMKRLEKIARERKDPEPESSSSKALSKGATKRYNLRPRPLRSATETVIRQILSESSATPEATGRGSRTQRKLGGTKDHGKQLEMPPPPLRRSSIESKSVDQTAYKAAAEKKEHLIKKLRAAFPEEKKFLDNISALPRLTESADSTAHSIHVFVDASNIMIGFQDCLKRSRGIPISMRTRAEPFSYHNLSLILERGRPAAKRVLAGSDKFPAIQEARLIGYEINILERVHKAKEVTPRKKKTKNHYNNNNNNSSSGNYTSATGQSSGSETTAGFTREKWVEQGVDEILHLKMLESILDAKTPSTIVLATGDAAEAEYSEGFLRMVERALERGWVVELVSFKQNISGAYQRKEFRGRWEKQFSIMILDEYVELLVGS